MPIDNVQPEQQPNSEIKPIDTTSSPDIGNTHVVGSPSLSDQLKLECLKTANSYSGSLGSLEDNYKRLVSLVNFDK